MTHVIVLIFLFRMLEQILIIIPSSHTLRFWNSLQPTVAQAPSSSVFKRLIDSIFKVHILYCYAICGPLLYAETFIKKKINKKKGTQVTQYH